MVESLSIIIHSKRQSLCSNFASFYSNITTNGELEELWNESFTLSPYANYMELVN